MPIVTVQIVIAEDENRYAGSIVQSLSDALGDLFESRPGTTWVKFEYLQRTDYAENHRIQSMTPRPTLVEVLKRNLPDETMLADEAAQIANCVAEILSRPLENVHVLFLPPAAGGLLLAENC